jgi:uncharacterized cupredoxin-like copper-binding protein
MKITRSFRLVAPVLAATSLAAVPAVLPSAALAASGSSKFFSANTAKHTATLKLLAGSTGANSGLNFDGYFKGQMTVTIPVGYKVLVVFTNKSQVAHSALITPYADRNGSNHPLAFPHAGTPNPTTGTAAGKTVKFTFSASKAGTYAIVCGFDGHAEFGMWDVLKVVKGGRPAISFKK